MRISTVYSCQSLKGSFVFIHSQSVTMIGQNTRHVSTKELPSDIMKLLGTKLVVSIWICIIHNYFQLITRNNKKSFWHIISISSNAWVVLMRINFIKFWLLFVTFVRIFRWYSQEQLFCLISCQEISFWVAPSIKYNEQITHFSLYFLYCFLFNTKIINWNYVKLALL